MMHDPQATPTFRPLKVYRVAWRMRGTGYSGHGEWSLDRDLIAAWVDAGNAEYSREMLHWIEEQEAR